MNCVRYDWFWWGDGDPIYFMIERLGERTGQPQPNEPPAGSIRDVTIRNVIAHGKGSCLITGYPKSWLDHLTLENIKFFISTDPSAAYDKAVHAIQFRYARNIEVKDVEVVWEQPASAKWQSALYFEDVTGLRLDSFLGGSGNGRIPRRGSRALKLQTPRSAIPKARQGTQVFLGVKGATSQGIYLVGNELHQAQTSYQSGAGVKEGAVTADRNF